MEKKQLLKTMSSLELLIKKEILLIQALENLSLDLRRFPVLNSAYLQSLDEITATMERLKRHSQHLHLENKQILEKLQTNESQTLLKG